MNEEKTKKVFTPYGFEINADKMLSRDLLYGESRKIGKVLDEISRRDKCKILFNRYDALFVYFTAIFNLDKVLKGRFNRITYEEEWWDPKK